MSKNPKASYEDLGFTILEAYPNNFNLIREYSVEWLQSLIGLSATPNLSSYHLWFEKNGVQHDSVFSAKKRHKNPESEFGGIIINDVLNDFLGQILPGGYDIWNEGLGWLAFRFVRPGFNDGYPFSCKEWGPAKKVISGWIPIVGFDPACTLKMVPGSHKKEHARYLPMETKFCKDEYRLCREPHEDEIYQARLKAGDLLLFHPRLLHSEDVSEGNTTRLSLEFRISPRT